MSCVVTTAEKDYVMGNTKIEWCDSVWNPVTGCSKVSAGCKNCYAERITNRFKRQKFTDVICHDDRLDQPLHWRKPRIVFVNSMSDLFHEDVPRMFIAQVWATMAAAPSHIYQILTKRPERAKDLLSNPTWQAMAGEYSIEAGAPIPPSNSRPYPLENVWLGVSIEDQKTADERIPLLLQTPAAVRFVSYEPALGPVDFRTISSSHIGKPYSYFDSLRTSGNDATGGHWERSGSSLSWVIAGGESGPNARRAHPDWFRSVRDQCEAAGVPFFMKQITERGRKVPFEDWPRDLRVREFPKR